MKAALLVVLLVSCSMTLAEPALPDDPVTIEDVRAEEQSTRARWALLGRVHAGYPLTVSGGVGAIRSRLPEAWECKATCPFQGWLFQAEPGLHGGRVSVGYATLMAEKRDNQHFLRSIYLGYGVKGVLLRTWGDHNLGPGDKTYAGAEFSFSVTRINFALGTMRRVSGPDHRDWIVTFGAGWGF